LIRTPSGCRASCKRRSKRASGLANPAFALLGKRAIDGAGLLDADESGGSDASS
jgi:hypothetical protein